MQSFFLLHQAGANWSPLYCSLVEAEVANVRPWIVEDVRRLSAQVCFVQCLVKAFLQAQTVEEGLQVSTNCRCPPNITPAFLIKLLRVR